MEFNEWGTPAPGSNFPKVPEQRSPVAEDSAHRNSDVDSKPWAKHHTLGWGPNQAAPGDQTRRAARPVGEVSSFMGSLPAGWIPADGTTFDETIYPELYAKLGNSNVTPNITSPSAPNLTNAIRAKAGF